MPARFPTCSLLGYDEPAVSSADRLAADLKAFECLLRQTLAAGGRLVAMAAETQADYGLDAISGHRIYHAINAANLDVSNALSHAARGHRQLDSLAHAIGIDLKAYGKTHERPAPGFTGADASDNAVDC